MTTRPHHRKLTDHLRGWSAEQVAGLMVRRPDLVVPVPPRDIPELAHRAQEQPSVMRAVAGVTLPENRLLQLVVSCRPNVPIDELGAALPDGVGLDAVEEPLVSLEAAALVWRHDGRVHCSATLRQAMPTTLGPPLQVLVKDQTVDYLRAVIGVLRSVIDASDVAGPIPGAATGPSGRPPRKAELVAELESLLVVPELVEAVLRSGPEECTELARAMADGRPVIGVHRPLYFSRSNTSSYYRQDPTYWLFERGLLLPDPYGRTAAQPREVGVALRGGRPVADMAIDRPVLATATVDPAAVETRAAARAALTVNRLADLLERWEHTPLKALKSGGLGATALKQAAAPLGTDPIETSRLIELANLAGLIKTTTVTRKENRTLLHDTFVVPSPAAATWLEQSVTRRWAQLAVAWLRAEHWPSASGGKSAEGKTAPVLSPQYADTAPERRRDVLEALASLDRGEATTADALASFVYWARPQPWLGVGADIPSTAMGWVHDEAALLGIVAAGTLSEPGRAILAGNGDRAEAALASALPAGVRTFTLQADLTATVVGTLDRDVLVELRLLAELESTGEATTWRFSDASLRRAIDSGRDAEDIRAFLEAHATKGVPKPLAYLVSDVARRHGHLQVGDAASFVTSEDPAVLADACSHRRTRKLGLRLLAPTVAVSPQAPGKVLDGLRDAGFLPIADGEHAPSMSIEAPGSTASVRAPDWTTAPGRPPTDSDLPERFRSRPHHHRSRAVVGPIGAEQAASLAAKILTGSQRSTGRFSERRRRGPQAASSSPPALFGDEPDEGEAPEALEDLLLWAFEHNRVLAIALGDADQLAEPFLLAVTEWEPDRIGGIDLTEGASMSILPEHIGAAADLGPAEELANLPLGGTRARPTRLRSRQGRRR